MLIPITIIAAACVRPHPSPGEAWVRQALSRPPLTCGEYDQAVRDAVVIQDRLDHAAERGVHPLGGQGPPVGTGAARDAAVARMLEIISCARARGEQDAADPYRIRADADHVAERREHLNVLRITWLYVTMVALALPMCGAWRTWGGGRVRVFAWGALAGAIAISLWDLRPTAEHVLEYKC